MLSAQSLTNSARLQTHALPAHRGLSTENQEEDEGTGETTAPETLGHPAVPPSCLQGPSAPGTGVCCNCSMSPLHAAKSN